ncbi:hypothetical protein SISSUDRAFT_1106646 [Sistotremastrum suecicum HHB10207 ss-3]|uniref:Endonuclease/exonuclease/phosphatase domain-containing protein n=1 Tax=Sistotremastrum suecicum HHB10207 ss-3 TaxID=1314776 RepID=A0A165WHI4_9AGAM|nr:hypothetical protein SISSUDRAFT_1106646 [Sistotremastrum suecicum HHB10207 ss-3]
MNGSSLSSYFVTSYQPNGTAVVDYALVSHSLIADSTSFLVQQTIDWSDHAYLALSLTVPQNLLPSPTPARAPIPHSLSPAVAMRRNLDHTLPLNKELLDAISCTPSRAALSQALYGVTSASPPPLIIFTAAASRSTPTSSAFAAVFHGPGSLRNRAIQIPGRQNYQRACLFAIWLALKNAPISRALTIYYSARSVFNDLLINAGHDAERGWRGPNANVIKHIILCIRSKPVPVVLKYLPKVSKHPHLIGAAKLCLSPQHPPRLADLPPTGPVRLLYVPAVTNSTFPPKLSGDTPPVPLPAPASQSPIPTNCDSISPDRNELESESDDTTPSFLPRSHDLRKRARQRIGKAKAANRQALYDKVRGRKLWWKDIRQTCDPSRSRPLPSAVSLSATMEVMSSRINVPAVIPDSFDHHRFQSVEAAAASIPFPSLDPTRSLVFSPNFTVDEVADVKGRTYLAMQPWRLSQTKF